MKAACYVRVSTDAQTERYGLPAQRRMLTDYCASRGWDAEIYEDAGISGETLDARPAMLRLLADAKARRIQVAIAVEMERFSRSESLFDWLVIKQAFREGGIRFGTPAQLFDPADTEDDFLTDLFGALAKREKRKIVERTRRGRVESARRGRYVIPTPPYGYRRSGPGVIVVYEPEAEIVRLIFALVLDGLGTRAIVRELARRGIPTAKGRRTWSWAMVAQLLTNPTYAGMARYNIRRRAPSGTGRPTARTRRPESDWITILVPAIVSRHVLTAAEHQLCRNAELSRRNAKRLYLLRGLVRCALCGRRMIGGPHHERRYYHCGSTADIDPDRRCHSGYLGADELEALVWQEVVRLMRHPQVVLTEARKERERRVGERDELLMRLEYVQTALRDLPAERDRAQTLYREGYATLEEVQAHLDRIERKRHSLDDERQMLEAKLSVGTADEEQEAKLARLIAHVAGRLDALSPTEQFDVLHTVIDRVIASRMTGVEIHAYVQLAVTEQAKEKHTYVRTAWTASSV
jgi:site-specific DNA recombinase